MEIGIRRIPYSQQQRQLTQLRDCRTAKRQTHGLTKVNRCTSFETIFFDNDLVLMKFTQAKAISTQLTHASAMQSSNTRTAVFNYGEKLMRRSTRCTRTLPEHPIAWREAEYAALQADSADTFDDRVSEDIFDVEDEHAEVHIIARRMSRGAD